MNNILPDLCLYRRQNQTWKYSGIDSREHCVDLEHFLNYPWPIDYRYNSRGFRDDEWPLDQAELQDAIWCLGDSFTVGIGVPLEHTWFKILQRKTNRRCINVSLDGGSNDWMARRGVEILKNIRPRHMVIHWSYVERREKSQGQHDEDRRDQQVKYEEAENVKNMQHNIDLIEQNAGTTTVVHSTIPRFSEYNSTQNLVFRHHVDSTRVIDYFDVIDWARDHHHYDRITAEHFVEQILKILNTK